MGNAKVQSNNPVTKAIDFTKSTWEEIKKVHTPSKQETIHGNYWSAFDGFLLWLVFGTKRFIGR